eukprot:GABV01000907.1.p1 GENE.GABV01000907.1~~GABV01000907.1.p1  ORF type:complete len:159 (-),score=31.04 GABV01000907.1:326-802(-)
MMRFLARELQFSDDIKENLPSLFYQSLLHFRFPDRLPFVPRSSTDAAVAQRWKLFEDSFTSLHYSLRAHSHWKSPFLRYFYFLHDQLTILFVGSSAIISRAHRRTLDSLRKAHIQMEFPLPKTLTTTTTTTKKPTILKTAVRCFKGLKKAQIFLVAFN